MRSRKDDWRCKDDKEHLGGWNGVDLGKHRIVVIGGYPEPYGGVSVHVKRLTERLRQNHIKCIVYDTSGIRKKDEHTICIRNFRDWISKCLLSGKDGDIVHSHDSGLGKRMIVEFLLLGLFKKRLIITLHSFNYEISELNWLQLLGMKAIVRLTPFFISVSPTIKRKLLDLGAKPEQVNVIPAFLPPVVREKEITQIPYAIWRFTAQHHPIVSANAYRITFHNDQDLYGIDLCIELCANLKSHYKNIGFIFSIPDIGDYSYFNRMREMVKTKKLEDNFLLITKPCQFYPILMKSDVFVRPTNTDGDAVSVREALYLRVPVVASDAAPRPRAVILFKNRDISDLTSKVLQAIGNRNEYKKQLEELEFEDYFPRIVQVYKKFGPQFR